MSFTPEVNKNEEAQAAVYPAIPPWRMARDPDIVAYDGGYYIYSELPLQDGSIG